MRHMIERAKVRLWCMCDGEWYVLVAASALVATFVVIMTGHVSLKY